MFEEETFKEMYVRLMNYLNKYNHYDSNSGANIKFSLKFNKLSYDLFYIDSTEYLLDEIEMLINHAHELRNYDIKAVLFVRKGLILDNQELINKGLSILKLLNLNELYNSVKYEIDMYFSTYVRNLK